MTPPKTCLFDRSSSEYEGVIALILLFIIIMLCSGRLIYNQKRITNFKVQSFFVPKLIFAQLLKKIFKI